MFAMGHAVGLVGTIVWWLFLLLLLFPFLSKRLCLDNIVFNGLNEFVETLKGQFGPQITTDGQTNGLSIKFRQDRFSTLRRMSTGIRGGSNQVRFDRFVRIPIGGIVPNGNGCRIHSTASRRRRNSRWLGLVSDTSIAPINSSRQIIQGRQGRLLGDGPNLGGQRRRRRRGIKQGLTIQIGRGNSQFGRSSSKSTNHGTLHSNGQDQGTHLLFGFVICRGGASTGRCCFGVVGTHGFLCVGATRHLVLRAGRGCCASHWRRG